MADDRSGTNAAGDDAAFPAMSDAEQIRRIEQMPKEVGVLLVVAGIGGLLLPGPVGTPFLILGGVVLWPRAFRGVQGMFERRFPKLHHQSMRQIVRFLDDMERRYPLEH
jgi:hypothetical protein